MEEFLNTMEKRDNIIEEIKDEFNRHDKMIGIINDACTEDYEEQLFGERFDHQQILKDLFKNYINS